MLWENVFRNSTADGEMKAQLFFNYFMTMV